MSVAASFLVFAAAGSAAAEQPKPEPAKARVLTGKERMQGKWADPQRVNDCKVPAEKRGDSNRPDDCSHIKEQPKNR